MYFFYFKYHVLKPTNKAKTEAEIEKEHQAEMKKEQVKKSLSFSQ